MPFRIRNSVFGKTGSRNPGFSAENCSHGHDLLRNAIKNDNFFFHFGPEFLVGNFFYCISRWIMAVETIFSEKKRIAGTGFSESGIPDPECHF